MDQISYKLILEDIKNKNFGNAISLLQKFHNENNKDFLYLRCILHLYQKNFYLSFDIWINAFIKFHDEIKLDKRFINLLSEILIGIERFDLADSLKDPKTIDNLFNKLVSWMNR